MMKLLRNFFLPENIKNQLTAAFDSRACEMTIKLVLKVLSALKGGKILLHVLFELSIYSCT